MSKNGHRNRKRTVLIVVCILVPLAAIVAGMLLPACSKAREKARRVSPQKEIKSLSKSAQRVTHMKPSVEQDQSPRETLPPGMNREDYEHTEANPFRQVEDRPLSTFSIDVDSASYANTRRFLKDDRLPPADAVRIEEMINYFDYAYPQPEGKHPFSITTEFGNCPWQTDHQLLHIGLQGRTIDTENVPPSNLVFLVDVSGSMRNSKKLPLLKKSLNLLVDQLRAQDRISMVVYAGSSGVALNPTSGDKKEKIKQAINSLEGGGSTAGSKGIKLAYKKANENFLDDGNNRVILATDGDFNVGITDEGGLVRLIEKKRESGIFLSVLGFGTGNYQGSKMEKLSNKGNGNYAYIDSILEAKKTLVEEFGGSMMTIAKDVKIQIEFNPTVVKSYRLIGYVNRQLDKEDFRDDTKDAGELGSGHSVTALYQVVPVGVESGHEPGDVPDLKYQEKDVKKEAKESGELGTVKFRYKKPDGDESILMKEPVSADMSENPSTNFHWSAAVAMFGMELRDDEYKGTTNYGLITEMARSGMSSTDASDYRKEFLRLVKRAETLETVSEE